MDAEFIFRSDERLTPEEFFNWVQQRPMRDVHHYELIQGRIVMSPPANVGHGRKGSWLCHKFWQHVEANDLGAVFDSSTGYKLQSLDVLEPDVSFISKERLAAAPEQSDDRFGDVVPDLVVEILSPTTARRDRTEKKAIYAANGVREYWLVDAKRRTVQVFHLDGETYDAGVLLRAGLIPSTVLPGLGLTVAEIFRK